MVRHHYKEVFKKVLREFISEEDPILAMLEERGIISKLI